MEITFVFVIIFICCCFFCEEENISARIMWKKSKTNLELLGGLPTGETMERKKVECFELRERRVSPNAPLRENGECAGR